MATGGSSWWRSTMTFDILFLKIVTLHILILKRQQNGKNKKTEYDDRVGAVNDVMCYEVQRCNLRMKCCKKICKPHMHATLVVKRCLF